MILSLRICCCFVFFSVVLGFYPLSAKVREGDFEVDPSEEPLLKKKEAFAFLEKESQISGLLDVKGWVDLEISQKWGSPVLESLKDSQKVQLPICDLEQPPLKWHFVGKDFVFLQLISQEKSDDFHFLKWKNGDWVRFFQNNIENHYENMICQDIWQVQPNQNNYIQIILNQHVFDVVTQKQKVLPMLQHAILQMSIRTKEKPSWIMGEVLISSVPPLEEGFLRLELWKKNKDDWCLLQNTTALVGDANPDIAKWSIKAKATSFSEVKMVLKVDEKGLGTISRTGFLSRLSIYDAVLQKK